MWTEIAMFGNSSKKDNLGKWAKSQLQNVHDCVQFCPTLWGPRTAAHQVTLSMEFNARILEQLAISYSRAFFFSNLGIKPTSLVSLASQVDSLPLHHLGSPIECSSFRQTHFPSPSTHSWKREHLLLLFQKLLLFYIGVQLTNNVVIASGHGRLTQPYIHMYLFSPKLPS